jgi:hypothetical protein
MQVRMIAYKYEQCGQKSGRRSVHAVVMQHDAAPAGADRGAYFAGQCLPSFMRSGFPARVQVNVDGRGAACPAL